MLYLAIFISISVLKFFFRSVIQFVGLEYWQSRASLIFLLSVVHIVRIEAACAAHPTADVFINFASFRRLMIHLTYYYRQLPYLPHRFTLIT